MFLRLAAALVALCASMPVRAQPTSQDSAVRQALQALSSTVGEAANRQLALSEKLGRLADQYADYDAQASFLQARQDDSDHLVGALRAVKQDIDGASCVGPSGGQGCLDPGQVSDDVDTITDLMETLQRKLEQAPADGLPEGDGRRRGRGPSAGGFTAATGALADTQKSVRADLLSGSGAVAAAWAKASQGSAPASATAEDAPPGGGRTESGQTQGGAAPGAQPPPTAPADRRRGAQVPDAGMGGSTSTTEHKNLKTSTNDWKPAFNTPSGPGCPSGHHLCQNGYSAWCEDLGYPCPAIPPPDAPQLDPCQPDPCQAPRSACSKYLDSSNKPGHSCTSACSGHACPSPQTCVDQNNGDWGCANGGGTCKSPTPYLCYYGPPLNRNGCSATPCPGSGVCGQPQDCPLVNGQYQLCIAGRCVPQDACHTPYGDPCCPDPNNCNSVCRLGGGAAGRSCEQCDPNQCTPLDGIAPKCGEGSKPGKDNCGHPGCTVPPPTGLACVDACTKWVPLETQTACGQMIRGHYIHSDGSPCSTERPESRPGLRCCFTADCHGPTPACQTNGPGTYRPGCFESGASCTLYGGPCASSPGGSGSGGCTPPDTATQTNTYDACVAAQCGSTVGTALFNPASCLQMCECQANPCACQKRRGTRH